MLDPTFEPHVRGCRRRIGIGFMPDDGSAVVERSNRRIHQGRNGYPLAYSSRVTGPTVVFVGGVLTDYRIWGARWGRGEPNSRVVAVSPRHFYREKWNGRSSDFTVAQHANDLDAFIEGQGGPVYLVGWSYGAHIAYEAARARPDLTRKLVLVEAPLDSLMATTDTNTNAVRIERAEATAKYLVRGDVDGGLNYSIDAINGAGAWAATPENFRQLLRDNAWTVVGIGREEAARVTCAEFGSLKMPVLLVQGELTAISSARRLRGSLKRSWRDRSRRTEWPWTSPYE